MGIVITSDDNIGINQNFRISAGPGAGKTHWLINHIKHIVNDSERLAITRKVACITYTNVAVDTIRKRLGTFSSRVEVCTFHSFLFQYIVGPYWHLIAESVKLKLENFRGETEQIFRNLFPIIKKEINQEFIRYDNAIEKMLRHALWTINSGAIKLSVAPKYRPDWVRIKDEFFMRYKLKLWENGLVNYDDIHYFAYRLINEYPYIAKLVSNQFPYILVDEFQDTTPIQAEVLKRLAICGSYVGVIGDKAQSIYSFNGVLAEHFDSFKVDGLAEYEIQGNRRSTNQIIGLLNCIRPDFPQIGIRNCVGAKPTLLIGPLIDAIDYCEHLCGAGKVKYLAYSRDAVKDIAEHIIGNDFIEGKKLTDLNDANIDRFRTISSLFNAIEHAYNKNMSMAYSELEKIGIEGVNAYRLIRNLYVKRSEFLNQSMCKFVETVRALGIKITNPRRGSNVRIAYESILYKQLLKGEASEFQDEMQSTIHKAKGAQYLNVFLALREETDINFLCKPSLSTNEACRVYYVAVSRAEDNLFINVPECNNRERQLKLQELPIEILLKTDKGWKKMK